MGFVLGIFIIKERINNPEINLRSTRNLGQNWYMRFNTLIHKISHNQNMQHQRLHIKYTSFHYGLPETCITCCIQFVNDTLMDVQQS